MTEAEAAAALHAREPIFHRAELGTSRLDFEAMIEDDFWEVGASGRVYERAYVLDALEQRFAEPHDDPWEVTEFACRAVGAAHFLVTYRHAQGARLSRRSTLWHYDGDWRAVYHQGALTGS
jgi:hypothetical protein